MKPLLARGEVEHSRLILIVPLSCHGYFLAEQSDGIVLTRYLSGTAFNVSVQKCS